MYLNSSFQTSWALQYTPGFLKQQNACERAHPQGYKQLLMS